MPNNMKYGTHPQMCLLKLAMTDARIQPDPMRKKASAWRRHAPHTGRLERLLSNERDAFAYAAHSGVRPSRGAHSLPDHDNQIGDET